MPLWGHYFWTPKRWTWSMRERIRLNSNGAKNQKGAALGRTFGGQSRTLAKLRNIRERSEKSEKIRKYQKSPEGHYPGAASGNSKDPWNEGPLREVSLGSPKWWSKVGARMWIWTLARGIPLGFLLKKKRARFYLEPSKNRVPPLSSRRSEATSTRSPAKATEPARGPSRGTF